MQMFCWETTNRQRIKQLSEFTQKVKEQFVLILKESSKELFSFNILDKFMSPGDGMIAKISSRRSWKRKRSRITCHSFTTYQWKSTPINLWDVTCSWLIQAGKETTRVDFHIAVTPIVEPSSLFPMESTSLGCMLSRISFMEKNSLLTTAQWQSRPMSTSTQYVFVEWRNAEVIIYNSQTLKCSHL